MGVYEFIRYGEYRPVKAEHIWKLMLKTSTQTTIIFWIAYMLNPTNIFLTVSVYIILGWAIPVLWWYFKMVNENAKKYSKGYD